MHISRKPPAQLFLLLLFSSLFLPGCAYFGPVAEGQDRIVVNAERTAKLGFAVVDTFLQWETATRDALPVEVSKAADKVRDEFPKAYAALRNATKAYKLTRSPDNKATLNTALALLQQLINTAILYLPPDKEESARASAEKLKDVPNLP